jgi:hypothetical protein
MSIWHEHGRKHVRKALDEAFESQNSAANGSTDIDESSSFCSNPAEYDWKYIGKQEMLVPYNCGTVPFHDMGGLLPPKLSNPKIIRWEKHRVWVVEGVLQPGESNVLARRRFYIDEDSWCILLGEGYDIAGTMVKCYMLFKCVSPAARKQGRWYPIFCAETKSMSVL